MTCMTTTIKPTISRDNAHQTEAKQQLLKAIHWAHFYPNSNNEQATYIENAAVHWASTMLEPTSLRNDLLAEGVPSDTLGAIWARFMTRLHHWDEVMDARDDVLGGEG